MKKILVASTNPGKMRELSAMLDMDVQWLTLADFDKIDEVVEDGHTFAENSRKKALGYAQATGLWTIADDSGLVIDALGGEPGVNSARYSGENNRNRGLLDHKNMEKVLNKLADVPDEERTCRFVCSLCIAAPDRVLAQVQGTVEGIVARQEQGANGFGYDPIFYLPQLGKTIAQLDDEQKNSLSHRGNAIRKLKPLLENLLH